VTALREYLQTPLTTTHSLRRSPPPITTRRSPFEQLKALVGAEEAANLRVLKQQLDEDFVDEVADA